MSEQPIEYSNDELNRRFEAIHAVNIYLSSRIDAMME